MTNILIAALVVQLVVTILAASYTDVKNRLDVIGMTSVTCSGVWLVSIVVTPWLPNAQWAPLVTAVAFVVSFGVFCATVYADMYAESRNAPEA